MRCEVVEALGGPKIDVATGRKDALEEDAENRLPDGSLIWNYAITTQVSIIENSVPHTGAMRAKLLAPLKWKKKTHETTSAKKKRKRQHEKPRHFVSTELEVA